MGDAREIKRNTDIVAVIQQDGVTLRKSGTEYVGLCPFHADGKPSMGVNPRKQIFKCFACGVGGDVFDYLYHRHGWELPQAIAHLEGREWKVDQEKIGGAYSRPGETKVWTPLPSAPGAAQDIKHYRHGRPSLVWTYHNAAGGVVGHVCRFNFNDGTKDVIPLCWCTDGKHEAWRWQGFGRPRPLYNLHLIAANPDAPILVVEGEKAADAAQKLFTRHIVTTWPGGANGLKYADLEPLHGRRVTFSPDNDPPGFKAMMTAAAMLNDHCQGMKWLPPPPDSDKGWDWADWTGTAEEAKSHAKNALSEVPEGVEIVEKTPKMPVLPEPPPEQEPPHQEPPEDYVPEPRTQMEEHFRILGFEKTESGTLAYFFYVRAALKVLRYTATSLSKSNMMTLAPLNWWELNFPSKKGMDVDMALNWIINTGNARGIFDDGCMRGRGAWMDKGKPIIHAGDRLVVDGQPLRLSDWDSEFFYEQMGSLGLRNVEPLGTKDANQIIQFLSQLSFERDLSAHLLAGWCVIAPVCGALTWRPHIWLTGGAGTGKTWTFKNVVRRLLGKFGFAVQSATTSSFIRQRLQSDALPVVFDEAESNTRNAADRITDILELVRSASAEDGGVIGKGSSFGTAKTYQMRSCFAFASIVVGAESQADQSRITVLVFKANNRLDKNEWWAKFKEEYFRMVTPEFVERLQARTVRLLPVILKNAQTFADAAASVLGEQRTGDQLGAMLSGAYSLYSTKEITFEEAVAWMRKRDWTEEKALESQRDERLLLDHLLEHKERVNGNMGMLERTIGELVAIASGKMMDNVVLDTAADAHLRRLGIKVEGEGFVIGASTTWLSDTLHGTPWERSTHRLLERLPGAETRNATYFSPGIKKRGVYLPLSLLAEENPEPPRPMDDLPF